MNVRSLLFGLMMLVWGNSLQGQEVSRGRLGISLGGLNGVSYDYALTDHLELGGTAAFVLGLGYGGSSKSFQFDGLTPLLELAPRYYFSRREEGQSLTKEDIFLFVWEPRSMTGRSSPVRLFERVM